MFAVPREVSRISSIPTRKGHAVTPRKTLFLVLASLLVVPAAAEDLKTYIWRDADGNVHYGDNPPRHEAYEQKMISVDGGGEPPQSAPAGDRNMVEDDDDEEPRGTGGVPERGLTPEDMAAIAEQEQLRLADDDDLIEQPRTALDDDTDSEPVAGSASNDVMMPPPAPPPPLIGP